MSSVFLLVTFGEHISADRIAGMVSSIDAYGNVSDKGSGHEFTVEVFRPSKVAKLKTRLGEWERFGFLRWREP